MGIHKSWFPLPLWTGHLFPVPVKLSCGADGGEGVRGTPGMVPTPAHPTRGLQAGILGQVCVCVSFGIHQTCSPACSRRRIHPYPSLLPFHPLNPSHLLEDPQNKSFIQWKFGASMKNECSNHSVEVMGKLLLTWEGAQRGFVNAPIIISVKVFMYLILF